MTSSKPPGDRAEIAAQLNSIRPDGSSDKPIKLHNVTAVLELAIERVDAAQNAMADALEAATARLLVETEKTSALARALRADTDETAVTEAAPPPTAAADAGPHPDTSTETTKPDRPAPTNPKV